MKHLLLLMCALWFMLPAHAEETSAAAFFEAAYPDDTLCTVIDGSPALAVLAEGGRYSLCAAQMQNGEYTLLFDNERAFAGTEKASGIVWDTDGETLIISVSLDAQSGISAQYYFARNKDALLLTFYIFYDTVHLESIVMAIHDDGRLSRTIFREDGEGNVLSAEELPDISAEELLDCRSLSVFSVSDWPKNTADDALSRAPEAE